MITAVGKGSRTRGLVEYLFGPGRAEEHTDQRIVAAWSETWAGLEAPDEVQRALLAAELDQPLSILRGDVGEQPPARHVYHLSISNHAQDRALTDEEWARVAHTVADRLGFTPTDTRAGVRWIAVHHGDAGGGRDHIHLQATLVREDGRGVDLMGDFGRLRGVAAEMRAEFGLEVRTREVGAGTPGLSRPEVQRQAATRTEPDRLRLRRTVRAVATAARTESEFVALAGEHGMIVRPRWDIGTGRTTVVGYSVARPSAPGSGADLHWFGGGRLGKDLTLPALRAGWVSEADAAVAWRAADTRTPTRTPSTPAGAQQRDAAARAIAEVREQLRAVPIGDVRAWSAAARDGAGVLAATAESLPAGVGSRVGRAAHALAKAVDKEPGQPVTRPADSGRLSEAARTMLTVSAASGGLGTAILLTQVLRLAETIKEAHVQAGRVVLAQAAATAAEHSTLALARLGGPRDIGEVQSAVEAAREYTTQIARQPIITGPDPRRDRRRTSGAPRDDTTDNDRGM